VRSAVIALLLVGCTATVTTAPPIDPDGPRNICESGERDVAGPRLLRRLTGGELDAAIRNGFGLSAAEWAGPAVPADAAGRNGFTNNVDRLIVDDAYAHGLLVTAEQVAGAVVEPLVLARVLPCAGAGDEACARTFLDTVGRRMYRRPLGDAEAARYIELFERITAEEDFATWVRWATVAMIQSPAVVYRSELGERDGDRYVLTGYEIATALAFALTGAPPDDALLDAAAAGELDTADGVAATARALAYDDAGAARPALRATFLAFTDQWLGLSALDNVGKSPEMFPGFTADVRAAMRAEADGYVDSVVFEQSGGVSALLTAPMNTSDPTLVAYYGPRPDGWGVGLLAEGALLTINAGNEWTSPTQRGKLIRERLLCNDMPPPPPVVGDIPAPTGAETTRQRYEEHTQLEACAGCHVAMDPMGFTFEHLDATGRYRETEGAFPIDDTGAIYGLESEPIDVAGPVELASALADRPETSSCMAAFMGSYTYGLDHHDTTCLISSLADGLAGGQLSIADFFVELTATKHFRERVD
jgi:hypothetical protein